MLPAFDGIQLTLDNFVKKLEVILDPNFITVGGGQINALAKKLARPKFGPLS